MERKAGAPIAAALVAMSSIQLGAALAKGLFAPLGPGGATAVRLLLATLILMAVVRPWRRERAARLPRAALLGYGASLGVMNLFYYLALERVPMGLVVAIEFLGPLAVALHASHRRLDRAWVALAVLGLALLLPLRAGSVGAIDPVGLVYALLAGAGWAAYIVFGTRAGSAHGGDTVAIGMLIGTLCVLPLEPGAVGTALAMPSLLPLALAVAVLSSALPYLLEMFAMQRLPTRVFGIFMSLEPALAALAGLALLGERLTVTQWTAVACVVVASFGSAATATSGGGTNPSASSRRDRTDSRSGRAP